jgi:transmembrane protein 17
MNVDTEVEEQKGFINLANFHEKYIKTSRVRVVESEISSYLPLQVLVYYNWYYCIFMFFLLAGLFSYKAIYLLYSQLYDMIVIAIWLLFEILRLYFAFLGNTSENFSELIAFLIITIFFATPLLAYQFALFTINFPLERAMGIIQAIFLVFEIIFGIIAIKKLVKNQTAIFFLRNSQPDKYYRVIFI